MDVVLAVPGAFEEVGWRGLAFPRMQARLGALPASLLLGVIHALFHLPIWLIPGVGFDDLPFPVYALLTIALAVLFAWILNSTGGSLLLVCLAHGAINAYPLPWGTALQAMPGGVAGPNIQIPVALVLAVCAVLVILRTRRLGLKS